ncbi:MAG: sensor domain-containing diguanylate cyclase [Spirochaetes bacterium]|nr:sensor domain-containing diguanylate cyclase [Spirochaetota bacterium]
MTNKNEQLQKLKDENNYLKEYTLKLSTLIDVNSLVVSSLDKETVLKTILEQTKILMSCSEASVLLVDHNKRSLYFALFSETNNAEPLAAIRIKRGEGIAGKVWQTGEPVITSEKGYDNRVSRKVDQKLDSKTHSLIAVPLTVKGEIIGVMEAINKNDTGAFTRDDLEIFQILSNQAAIAIYNADLYEMATRDGMTKLYIRRYFDTRLAEEFARSSRYNRDIALIMFDIDHFKSFNDNYGHQLGDKVLIKTAEIIQNFCRACDIPSRFGGEEFSVILPETGIQGAENLAERIRAGVESETIYDNNQKIKLTISAGIATRQTSGSVSAKKLVSNADKALYMSKQNGRNMVTLFHKKE